MKPSPVLRTLGAGAILLALATPAHPVAAQQEASSIVGTVLDQTTLLPIPGGTVSLVDLGIEIKADERGNFRFEQLPPRPVTLRVDVDRYSSAVDQVELTAGEISVVQVHLLPVDRVLAEVLVITGRRPIRDANVVENTGQENVQTAADLLEREIPGLTIGRSGNVGSDASLLIRGVNTIQGNPQPTIYLDGVRIGGGYSTSGSMARIGILNDIPASHIRRIRVLKGPATAARYPDSANGVILIETIRGSRE